LAQQYGWEGFLAAWFGRRPGFDVGGCYNYRSPRRVQTISVRVRGEGPARTIHISWSNAADTFIAEPDGAVIIEMRGDRLFWLTTGYPTSTGRIETRTVDAMKNPIRELLRSALVHTHGIGEAQS
jgi:hypothetical protein